jgi:CubicO group peptidase (beta-lactamase class C family)
MSLVKKMSALAALVLLAALPVRANGFMDKMEADIEAGLLQDITSVLVMKRGAMVYERYFGAGGPAYPNNTRSATKTVTSLALGAAIRQGAFSGADDRVMPLFTPYAPFANSSPLKEDIRLRDLLTMSSALDCNDSDSTTPGYEDRMHEQDDWTRFVVDLPVMQGWGRDRDGLGPFRYCTAGTFLLGQAIERASGQSLDTFVDDALFTPLGIQYRQWYRSPTGEEQAGGGLLLYSRDLLKLGRLALQDGVWNNRRILPEGWIAESTKPYRQPRPHQGYGYQWWLQPFTSVTTGLSHAAFYMSGNGGNKVAVFKDLNMVVVITAERYNTPGMHEQTSRMLQDYILPAFEVGVVN